MGDRLTGEVCLGCGMPLIEDNDWHCCSICTENIKKQQKMILSGQKVTGRESVHAKFKKGIHRTLKVRFS